LLCWRGGPVTRWFVKITMLMVRMRHFSLKSDLYMIIMFIILIVEICQDVHFQTIMFFIWLTSKLLFTKTSHQQFKWKMSHPNLKKTKKQTNKKLCSEVYIYRDGSWSKSGALQNLQKFVFHWHNPQNVFSLKMAHLQCTGMNKTSQYLT
jgi:hypothetical protein